MVARVSTMLAGSDGNGWSHVASLLRATSPSGSALGPAMPDGSGRRLALSSAFRQARDAIRYSQVRSDERPSKVS